MHVLPRLRRRGARWALPELRRRPRAKADPPGRPAVARSRLDEAGRQGGRLRVTGMPRGPSRRGQVPPFIAMDVLRAANAREAEGHSVIHLEVGQPGTPAPQAVLDAARAALAQDRIGYTDALGIQPLREAITRHYREHYAVEIDPA